MVVTSAQTFTAQRSLTTGSQTWSIIRRQLLPGVCSLLGILFKRLASKLSSAIFLDSCFYSVYFSLFDVHLLPFVFVNFNFSYLSAVWTWVTWLGPESDLSAKFDAFRLDMIKDLQLDLNTNDSWLHLDLSLLTWEYLRFKGMLLKKCHNPIYLPSSPESTNVNVFHSQQVDTFSPRIHFVWSIKLKNKPWRSGLPRLHAILRSK